MRKRFIAALAAATLFATFANAESYICQIRPHGPVQGLISDSISVEINDATFNAVVSDAIIQAANGRNAGATVTTNSAKRLSMKWVLQRVIGSRKKIVRIRQL